MGTKPLDDAGRLRALDAARGFAALYVVAYHMALMPTPPLEVPAWAARVLLNGGTGVSLFFVISGFTMCLTMAGRAAEPGAARQFYVRRFLRIAPLFYFWVAATLVRDYFTFGVLHTPREVLTSLTFAYQFVPGMQEGFVWASWTLGVEMAFYLVFPLIFRYANSLPRAVAFFWLAILADALFAAVVDGFPPGRTRGVLQYSVIHFIPCFASGVVTYFAYARLTGNDRRVTENWGAAILTGSVTAFWMLLSGRLNVVFDGMGWQAVLFGGLVLGLTLSPVSVFVNRVTAFYGTISYSLYLNHPTLVFFLVPVYRKVYALPYSGTVRYGLCLGLTLTLLTVASYITYRLIERPGIRLSRIRVRWPKSSVRAWVPGRLPIGR